MSLGLIMAHHLISLKCLENGAEFRLIYCSPKINSAKEKYPGNGFASAMALNEEMRHINTEIIYTNAVAIL